MKKHTVVLLSLFMLMLTSCEVIGGIFKAGVWSGIIMVVGIIVLIVYLISRAGRNK